MPEFLDGNIQPSLDFEEHLHIARARRVANVGFDGANFNLWNIDSSGAGLVRLTSSLSFTGTISSTATVNLASSVTLFMVGAPTLFAQVNTASPQVTVNVASLATLFVVGSPTLFAFTNQQVTVNVASLATLFVVGSPTLFAVVNTASPQVTVNIASGATIGVGNHNVTAWIAATVTATIAPSVLITNAMAIPTAPAFGGYVLRHNGVTWDAAPHSFVQTRIGAGTGSAAGLSVDMTSNPMSKFCMLVENGTGTTSAWNIDLQGSIDGGTWVILGNNTSAVGTAQALFVTEKCVRFMRSNVQSITGGGTCRIRLLASEN